MATFNKIPVLSKVKIDDVPYYLKDGEARELLEAEIERAERAEGDLQEAITQEVTDRNTAIANAINDLDVTDAAVAGKYVSAVSEVDGKISVTRADLPAADAYTIVKQATPDTGDASTYFLTKNGTQVGAKINIAKDQFLKDAKFCATAADVPAGHTPPTGLEFPAILFIFTRTSGDEDVWVPVKELVDAYTAGDGLTLDNNKFSVVKDPNSENYLTVSATGVKVFGIDAAIAAAVTGKADKVASATNGNFAGLDANGNLTDSGKKAADFATAAQGTKADTALQGVKVNGTELTADGNKKVNVTVATGSTNGTIAVNGANVAVKGLNGLAFKSEVSKSDLDEELANELDDKGSGINFSDDVAPGSGYDAELGLENKDGETVDVVGFKAGNDIDISIEEYGPASSGLTIGLTDAAHASLGKADTAVQSITLNGDRKTGTDIDLGTVATVENTVSNVTYTDSTHTLSKTINGRSSSVHKFGDLADENLEDLEVKGQTITGVKATGTTTGELTGTLGYDPTQITSTGVFTATGSIDVTLSGNTFNAITSVGTLPSYTDGSFSGGKATVIDTTKFNGGAAASLGTGFYTAGSDASLSAGAQANLTAQTTNKFVKKAMNMTLGTGDDAECLIISEVATTDTTFYGDAVTDRGTFTPNTLQTLIGGKTAVIDTTKFNGGSAASLGTGFYTAGSDAAYTAPVYVAGTLPEMSSQTVAVASKSFTGTANQPISVVGYYDKANLGTVAFAGQAIELAVGNIVVADKAVTKKA